MGVGSTMRYEHKRNFTSHKFGVGVAIWMMIAIPTMLWILARDVANRFATASTIFGSLSGYFAVVGTVLLALDLLLIARIGWIESVFGGMDRVLRFHHYLGVIAFSLVALHPAFLAMRYAVVSWPNAAELWIPQFGDWRLLFGQIALYIMIPMLLVTLFVRVRHQVFIKIQQLLGLSFVFAAIHALSVGGDTRNFLPLRTFMFVVVAVGFFALGLKLLSPLFSRNRFIYEVASISNVKGHISDIVLKPIGQAMHYVAGQFIFLKFKHVDIENEFHPFSIASSPLDPNLRIVVKDLGNFSHDIASVGIGARAQIQGPFGRFTNTFLKQPRQVWIAGGIGVAPFLSMASNIDPKGAEIDLFYCFVAEGDASYLAELKAIAETQPRLRVHAVCEEQDGFVSAETIAKTVGPLLKCDFLICGPRNMMLSLRDQLQDKHVRKSNIHYEEFTFA
jgi:predicted ferric reductase